MNKQTTTPFNRPLTKDAVEKTSPIIEALRTGFGIEFDSMFLQALFSFSQKYRFPVAELLDRDALNGGDDPKVPGTLKTDLHRSIVLQECGPSLLYWNEGRKWQRSVGGALVADKLIRVVFAKSLNEQLVALLEINDGDVLVDFFEPSLDLLPVFGDKVLPCRFEEWNRESIVYSYDETRVLVGDERFTNLRLEKRND